MYRYRWWFEKYVILLLSLLFVSCEEENPAEPVLNEVVRVDVEPVASNLWVGDSVKTYAEAVNIHGDPIPDVVINWSSDNENIASVDENGMVTALGFGTAAITASAGDISAVVDISVSYYDLIYDSGPEWQSGLFRIALDGTSAPQQIILSGIYAADPQPSPDGQLLAFVVPQSDFSTEVYTSFIDGSNAQRITNNLDPDNYPAWSPDGQWLTVAGIYGGKSDIVRMRPDGTEVSDLTPDPNNGVIYEHGSSWSPDGVHIAYLTNQSGITRLWVMNADGTNHRELSDITAYSKGSPDWDKSNTLIAFSGIIGNDASQWDIITVSLTGNLTTIYNLPDHQYMPAWSPDGKWLAFVTQASKDVQPEIYMIRRDGTDLRLVTREPEWGGGRNPVFIPIHP